MRGCFNCKWRLEDDIERCVKCWQSRDLPGWEPIEEKDRP